MLSQYQDIYQTSRRLPSLKNLAKENKKLRRLLRISFRLKTLFPEHLEIDAANFVAERASEFGLDLLGESFAKMQN